ncbi:MAG TPA: universal stress protein [Terriglobales bacterium]|nr:universal stress protein [Terriglobales bacterium]
MPTTLPQVARISLKNILIPTDFSEVSNAALPFARALSKIYGATILTAHVLPREPLLEVVPDRLPAQDDRGWQEARRKLGGCTHEPSIDEAPCRALVDCGDLADVIPAMIREHDIDLVVLGTHGRRGVSRIVLGSGAEKIYRSAQCPVMTVGPKAQKIGPDWQPRRILCPVDAARDPEPALHYALSLAEENQAQITVLQAVPMVPWQHRASVERQTRHSLESLMPVQASDWCRPEFRVRWEHPVEAILRAATECEPDLVVMGVRKVRATAWSAHLPWPIASEVVARAPCPVLTVRV